MNGFDPHCTERTSFGPHSDQQLKCECSGCVAARYKYAEAVRVHSNTFCDRLDCEYHDVSKVRGCKYWQVSPMPCDFYKQTENSYVAKAHRAIALDVTIKAYLAADDVFLAVTYGTEKPVPYVTVSVKNGYDGKAVVKRLMELHKTKEA